MLDLFLINTKYYTWIIVLLLSAVWTLILTALVHCKGSVGEKVIKLYNSLHLFQLKSWMGWGRVSFNFHFLVSYSFKEPSTWADNRKCCYNMAYANTAQMCSNGTVWKKWNQTFDNYTSIVPLNVQIYLSVRRVRASEALLRVAMLHY